MKRALESVFQKHRLATGRYLSSSSEEGYQSIGSFHSENLAELMAASDTEYVAPPLPFPEATSRFPDESLSSDFLLDLQRWTFLNHGAFGAALAVGHQRAEQWRRHLEAQPLRFFDRDLLPHLAHSTRLLADFIGATRRENATLLQNVTSGLNSAIAGYVREFGASSSHIFLWDTSYGSVKKMARHYCGGDNVTEIPLQSQYLDRLAFNPETVFQQALADTIERANLKGKHLLFIIDHTSSNTALTFPVERLAAQMKEAIPQSVVLVDGAHGLLAQELDIMQKMKSVDIYLSNGHKWLSSPRGVAVMVLQHSDWKDTLLRQPAVISHGVDEKDLLSRFVWDGTRDYAAALSIPVVLEYWERRGPAAVRQELKHQLGRGIGILAQHWHPDSLQPENWPGAVTLTDFGSSVLSPMTLVRLPAAFSKFNTSSDAKRIQDYLFQEHIEVPVKCIDGKLYVRISCHVYNRQQDFETLGLAIQQYPGI